MLEQTHFQHNDEKHGIEKKKEKKKEDLGQDVISTIFPKYNNGAPAKIVQIEKGINEMFLNSQPDLLSKLANIRCGWHRMETILQWFGFSLLVGIAGGAADGLHDNGPLCGSIDSL